MTDLEITKLCAEAMGYDVVQRTGRKEHGWWAFELCKHYQPLHDDAQAMALLKTQNLLIELDQNKPGKHVRFPGTEIIAEIEHDPSGNALNRAICECVAKMWALKPSGARPRT